MSCPRPAVIEPQAPSPVRNVGAARAVTLRWINLSRRGRLVKCERPQSALRPRQPHRSGTAAYHPTRSITGAIMEDRFRAILSRSAVSRLKWGFAAPTIRKRRCRSGGVFNATARSGSLPARNELEVFRGHLREECLVLALWKRPQDRRGLLAGVPVLAAADPDGPRKGGTEPGEEFLRCGGSR